MSQPARCWEPNWQPSGVIEKSRGLQKELWRQRLVAARTRHEAAFAELRRIMDMNAPDRELHPNSWQGVLEARFAESDALSEYIEALKVYSAFTGVAGESSCFAATVR